MADAGTKKSSDFRIQDSDVKGAEYAREIWCVTVQQGVTLNDLKRPEVWANVAAKLKPWTILEVRAEDGTYFAWLVVLAAERTWAKVDVLLEKKLTTTDVSKTQASGVEGYTYQWKGAKLRHCIVRESDGEVVHSEAPTKPDALHWLEEHRVQLTS